MSCTSDQYLPSPDVSFHMDGDVDVEKLRQHASAEENIVHLLQTSSKCVQLQFEDIEKWMREHSATNQTVKYGKSLLQSHRVRNTRAFDRFTSVLLVCDVESSHTAKQLYATYINVNSDGILQYGEGFEYVLHTIVNWPLFRRSVAYIVEVDSLSPST